MFNKKKKEESMNDLFNKFQENKKSGQKKSGWSIVDCLVLIALASQKTAPKVIAAVLGRTPNSITYKLSDRTSCIGPVTNYKELCERINHEYKAENEQRDIKAANDFIAKRTTELKTKKEEKKVEKK